MYLFNIGTIGTFLFLSLGITFVLCCLLVYHFKRRLDLFEQKSDTIFEIVNNLLTEISNIKQKQNVLFMLIKNQKLDNVNSINSILSNKAVVKDESEEDVDEEDVDEEDVEEEDDEDEQDDEDGEKEAQEKTPEDDPSSELTKRIVQLNNSEYSVFTANEEIQKIKVVDENEDDVIDLTTGDEIPHQESTISNYISQLLNNGKNDGLFSHNEIDLQMLNLAGLQHFTETRNSPEFYALYSPTEPEEKTQPLSIHILDEGVNNLTDIEEIEDCDILPSPPTQTTETDAIEQLTEVDDYADMPELEPIDMLVPNETEVIEPAQTEIPILNQPELVEDSMSVISEDITIWKKGEKDNYKKMGVQLLREIVTSKGIVEDASKLKKNELLALLSPPTA